MTKTKEMGTGFIRLLMLEGTKEIGRGVSSMAKECFIIRIMWLYIKVIGKQANLMVLEKLTTKLGSSNIKVSLSTVRLKLEC